MASGPGRDNSTRILCHSWPFRRWRPGLWPCPLNEPRSAGVPPAGSGTVPVPISELAARRRQNPQPRRLRYRSAGLPARLVGNGRRRAVPEAGAPITWFMVPMRGRRPLGLSMNRSAEHCSARENESVSTMPSNARRSDRAVHGPVSRSARTCRLPMNPGEHPTSNIEPPTSSEGSKGTLLGVRY